MKFHPYLGRPLFLAVALAAGAAAMVFVASCSVQDSPEQPSGTVPPIAEARPADANATTQPALVTQDHFMKVMKQSCARCHMFQCASVNSLEKAKWLVPGKPDNSPVYTIINPKVSYHKLSAADKQIIHDFIQQMKG